MALLLSRKAKSFLSRLQPFIAMERFKCSFVEEGGRAQFSSDTVEVSKWRKLDSRNLGIARWKISSPSLQVLKTLRNAGFDAYLVGGCVRDLILSKVPKDFDVITTARLRQVKRKFGSAIIIGRKFPICVVTIKGSGIEVSSFDTVAKEPKRRDVDISQIPKGCDPGDLARWKNSMNRDFTVNSLFFDPFENVVFDYTNAMRDLRSSKLRTVIPANLSFKEDQARILRGLRLAARLNLTFSKETEDALCSLSSSVAELSNSRINLEMNYMLSYGAAEPSLLLLKRFNLLEILLPFHAAYLSKQVDNGSHLRSLMLMKLFFNLDQLITCDQPCTDSLWVAMLAFHMAIFTNPQHAVVVLTLAVLLCHRTWEESIEFARKAALTTRIFVPEILDSFNHLSDDEIVKRVNKFAGQVVNSVDILINKDCLFKSMARFPESTCSGLLFVSQATAKRVKRIFNILADGVDSVKAENRSKEINYGLLSKGDEGEIKFVLGKVIFRTMVQKLAETEAIEDKKDDAQVMNPRHNLPKSVGPGKLHHSRRLAQKKATQDDIQETNPPENLKVLDQKTLPRKRLHRKRPAEKEATKYEEDDVQELNTPHNMNVLDQKTQPRPVGSKKPHITGKNAKKASETMSYYQPTNGTATDHRFCGKPGSPGKILKDEHGKDENSRHVLSSLFK